mgnify:CR=1 FL=1
MSHNITADYAKRESSNKLRIYRKRDVCLYLVRVLVISGFTVANIACAEPLDKITLEYKPLARGDNMRRETHVLPDELPNKVILFGSPPKLLMKE